MFSMAKKKKTDWSERLKQVRADQNLTQEEAAARIKVSQSIWSAWERGAKVPSPSMQLLIDLTFPE